jgi:ABC-type transport system involved in cytochrome c biogenesis permease subunit
MKVLRSLGSLRLAVVLMGAAMFLVLAGTLAQREADMWKVQKEYFHSWLARIQFQDLLPMPEPGKERVSGSFPFPGGYSVGAALLLNLLAALVIRQGLKWRDLFVVPPFGGMCAFLWVWQTDPRPILMGAACVLGGATIAGLVLLHRGRAGLLLTHVGVILLFAGEGLTSFYAREAQMRIREGESVNYTYDSRRIELAVVNEGEGTKREVLFAGQELERFALPDAVGVPAWVRDSIRVTTAATSHLRQLRQDSLPFIVRIDEFMRNSEFVDVVDARRRGLTTRPSGNTGDTAGVTAVARPQPDGTDRGEQPAAYVTLLGADQQHGPLLLSPVFVNPQRVAVAGKTYSISLRYQRQYKPYTIHLEDFTHERYTGTGMPRNFSSRVRLIDPEHGEDRPVLIRMNSPLRYRGETFYQSSYVGEDTTILQVVDNPGWIIPYLSCVLAGIGLSYQFIVSLAAFVQRRAMVPVPRVAWQRPAAEYLVAGGLVALGLLYLLMSVRPPSIEGPFDLNAMGRLPVSFGGRAQPLDSLARKSLKSFCGKEEARLGDERYPAIQWLADAMAQKPGCEDYQIFRIDEPGLVGILTTDTTRKYFSMKEVRGGAERLESNIDRMRGVDPKNYDRFQQALARLWENLEHYSTLAQPQMLRMAPPLRQGEEWAVLGMAQANPGAAAVVDILQHYHAGKAQAFNDAVADYRAKLDQWRVEDIDMLGMESFLNRFDFEGHCRWLYLVVFILACCAWMGWPVGFRRAAMWVLVLTLAVHTLGLIARVVVSGRPPMTNLYSSAVFVAWGAAAMALVLEAIFRNGFGAATAGAVGFLGLLVAGYLSAGDALKGNAQAEQVLRAVLDTNFWLATHVSTIALGYCACFLAGALGITYIICGLFTPALSPELGRSLDRMTYGVVCFAMLFSFIGTVTGGIWADQSWGRFWGWDPKENGALLIVLWNAIILHARWDRWIGGRGTAVLAVGGNAITAWSWFGTNMLGVGLHSYGFMSAAAIWLTVAIVLQLVIMALGGLPMRLWKSTGEPPDGPTPPPLPARAPLIEVT